jgi:hypothetical protein
MGPWLIGEHSSEQNSQILLSHEAYITVRKDNEHLCKYTGNVSCRGKHDGVVKKAR